MENLKVEDVLPIKEDHSGDYVHDGSYRIHLAFPNMTSYDTIPFKMTNKTKEEAHLARLGIFEIIKQWAKQLSLSPTAELPKEKEYPFLDEKIEIECFRSLDKAEVVSFVKSFNAKFAYLHPELKEAVLEFIFDNLSDNRYENYLKK